MTIRADIRQLSNAAFRKECERIEREQRRRNVFAGVIVVMFFIVAIIALSELARAIGTDIRIPFALR